MERKDENFDYVSVKLTAGKLNDENELSSMGITTIWREKMILFCFVSSDDIPNIQILFNRLRRSIANSFCQKSTCIIKIFKETYHYEIRLCHDTG